MIKWKIKKSDTYKLTHEIMNQSYKHRCDLHQWSIAEVRVVDRSHCITIEVRVNVCNQWLIEGALEVLPPSKPYASGVVPDQHTW